MTKSILVAIIDFLFGLNALWIGLLIVMLAQNHSIQQGNITSKAEFIATVEWSNGSNDDVDLWMQNGHGDIAFFKRKDAGLMTIDHDDTGISNNTIIDANGNAIKADVRREVGTIRSIIPGKTTIDVVLYAWRSKPKPVTAKVQVIKLNPYQVIAEKEVSFDQELEDKTIVSFIVNPDGSIGGIDTITQVSLLKQELVQ